MTVFTFPEDTCSPAVLAETVEEAIGSPPCEQLKPGPKRKVRVIEYDMSEFFSSCVQAYAELTHTDPDTYPMMGTPVGPELSYPGRRTRRTPWRKNPTSRGGSRRSADYRR